MTKLKLYDLDVSGNCYKVRLFLSLLDISYEQQSVDLMGGEQKSPEMLQQNPFGEIPVLVDGENIIRDSQAILVYLAVREGREDWLPLNASNLASVTEWLMVAENEIARGPGDARLHDKFGIQIDVNSARQNAERVTKIIETHLINRDWLCGDAPTIADIACFPYIALGHEGGLSLDAYPAVRSWIGRIKELPNFISMPGF